MNSQMLFWIALALVAYTWLGYPALIWLCERLMYRPPRRRAIEPMVSVLLIAHDEEAVLRGKLENLLQLDYPRDKLEIVVASDGSHDRTPEIARAFAGRGVQLREFPVRRGKPSVMNDLVPKLRGEIVLLLDARQRLEEDALRRLLEPFADPEVGGVSGELVFSNPDGEATARSMDTYWRYEKWLRNKEAGIHSTVGGTGAIFALRRELFRPLPGETILDDVVLPLQIVKRGYRVVLELGARAWDTASITWDREFMRKARTLSGNWQILFNFRRMGCGILGPVSFQYYSHKVMRLLCPFLLVALLATSIDLAKAGTGPERLLYQAMLAIQLACYALGLTALYLPARLRRLPPVHLAHAFLVMQVAVLVGLLRYCSGRDDALWDKSHALDPASMRQRLLRLFLDSTIFTCGFLLAFHVRYLGSPPRPALESYLQLFPYFELRLPLPTWLATGPLTLGLAVPLVMLIPLAVFYFFRVNEPRIEEITPEYFLTLIKGVAYATIILFLVIYVRRSAILQPVPGEDAVRLLSIPTSTLVIGFLLNCAIIGGWRLALSHLRRARAAGETPLEPRDLLLVSERPLPAGEVTRIQAACDPPARLISVAGAAPHADFIPPGEFEQTLAMVRPDAVLVAAGLLDKRSVLQVTRAADEREIVTDILPGEQEMLLCATHPRLVSYIPVVEPGHSDGGEAYVFGRRALDLLLGLLSLAGVPFLFALLLASRRIAPADRQVLVKGVCRIGRKGRIFVSPRLRFTDGWPRWWVWLARCSLLGSELLQGQRSLVGPRPLLPSIYRGLSPLARRFLVCRPGIICPRRVSPTPMKKLDRRAWALVYYARHRNLAMDLSILLRARRARRFPADAASA